MPDKHALLKGFVFRLIKKRIAGATLGAALEEARENYSMGMRTTLTFLNDSVDDQTKARYNANAYVQLSRQASRLHLNADISLRLSQVGSRLNHGILDKCLRDVMKIVEGSDTRVWFEAERSTDMQELFDMYRKYRKEYMNIGIELPLWYPLEVSTIRDINTLVAAQFGVLSAPKALSILSSSASSVAAFLASSILGPNASMAAICFFSMLCPVLLIEM